VPVMLRDVIRFEIDRYVKAVGKTSMKTNIDFIRILEETKKILYKVKCPTLIIQCTEDETIPPKSAYEIKKRISGQSVLKEYTGGMHLIFQESIYIRDEICRDILKWISV
jgi:esterase/lipase